MMETLGENYLKRLAVISADIDALNRERSEIYKEARINGLSPDGLRARAVIGIDSIKLPPAEPSTGGWRQAAKSRLPRFKPQQEGQCVYFAVCEPQMLIKVGMSGDVHKRLNSFRQSPAPLILWFTIQGGREREVECHEMLSEYLFRGEWFRLCDGSLAAASSLGDKFGVDLTGPFMARAPAHVHAREVA